jgi:formylglycine-generating enzyme required for sulfatase activity
MSRLFKNIVKGSHVSMSFIIKNRVNNSRRRVSAVAISATIIALLGFFYSPPLSQSKDNKTSEGAVPQIRFIKPSPGEIISETPYTAQWTIENLKLEDIQSIEILYHSETVKVFRQDEILKCLSLELPIKEGRHMLDIKVSLTKGTEIFFSRPVFHIPKFPAGMERMPGGKFMMGSSREDESAYFDEAPIHEVLLPPFWMDRHEVTNSQYRLCVSHGVCRASEFDDKPPFGRDDHPVVGIDWGAAKQYCEWRNTRLPTEAEWEYVAAATGDDKQHRATNENAWHALNSQGHTHAVGQKQSNHFAIFDMSGNAWEWCSDWYADDTYLDTQKVDPDGAEWGNFRVLKGGSWATYPKEMRPALRFWLSPNKSNNNTGFRCARDI